MVCDGVWWCVVRNSGVWWLLMVFVRSGFVLRYAMLFDNLRWCMVYVMCLLAYC